MIGGFSTKLIGFVSSINSGRIFRKQVASLRFDVLYVRLAPRDGKRCPGLHSFTSFHLENDPHASTDSWPSPAPPSCSASRRSDRLGVLPQESLPVTPCAAPVAVCEPVPTCAPKPPRSATSPCRSSTCPSWAATRRPPAPRSAVACNTCETTYASPQGGGYGPPPRRLPPQADAQHCPPEVTLTPRAGADLPPARMPRSFPRHRIDASPGFAVELDPAAARRTSPASRPATTNKPDAAQGLRSAEARPQGPITNAAVSRLSAVAPSGATTVTLARAAPPDPRGRVGDVAVATTADLDETVGITGRRDSRVSHRDELETADRVAIRARDADPPAGFARAAAPRPRCRPRPRPGPT